jgi:hypothetical protein
MNVIVREYVIFTLCISGYSYYIDVYMACVHPISTHECTECFMGTY